MDRRDFLATSAKTALLTIAPPIALAGCGPAVVLEAVATITASMLESAAFGFLRQVGVAVAANALADKFASTAASAWNYLADTQAYSEVVQYMEPVTVGNFSIGSLIASNENGHRTIAILQDSSRSPSYAVIQNMALFALESTATQLAQDGKLDTNALAGLLLPIADCSGDQRIWSSASQSTGDVAYQTSFGQVVVNGEMRPAKNPSNVLMRMSVTVSATNGDGTPYSGVFEIKPRELSANNPLLFA
jgi:hypothetical protein